MSSPTPTRPTSPAEGQIWQRGFLNLFRRELQTWWWRRLLISLILWTLLVTGLPSLLVGGLRSTGQAADLLNEATVQRLGALFTIWTSLPMFGAIFSMQGVISDERKTGTLAWVLSKPIMRSAFYLAKLLSNALVKLVVIVLLQGAIAVLLIAAQGGTLNFSGFVGAMLLVALVLLFYLSLTLMLDTILRSRAATIAIPVAVLIGGAFLPTILAALNQRDLAIFLLRITPWALDSSNLQQLALGQSLREVSPIICTAAWTAIFTLAGISQFNRQET
jgi:ABC-type transport system involved in multi-copper enzyme maturation permease subunit